MLKLALEGAGFISAYDRSGISRSLGVRPPEKLDERAALELAVKQGLGVVLSGSVEPSRQRLRGVGQGDAGGDRQRHRHCQEQGVEQGPGPRRGDEAGESRFARRSATTRRSPTSASPWRPCRPPLWKWCVSMPRPPTPCRRARYEEALQSFAKAVELDPNFGLGYAGMAIASREPGQAAGCREVHQGSRPPSRQHDGARTVSHARSVLLHHRRLSGLRQGIRRPDRPVRG